MNMTCGRDSASSPPIRKQIVLETAIGDRFIQLRQHQGATDWRS
jgi:hypothetical protein